MKEVNCPAAWNDDAWRRIALKNKDNDAVGEAYLQAERECLRGESCGKLVQRAKRRLEKREKRHGAKECLSEFGGGWPFQVHGGHPAKRLERREDRAFLDAFLRAQDPRVRVLARLYLRPQVDAYGQARFLSYDEVGRQIGCSGEAVRKRLRALARRFAAAAARWGCTPACDFLRMKVATGALTCPRG